MHLAPLHNVLLTAVRLLEADAAALRLLPAAGVAWQPLDVAVGDTALLLDMQWREGDMVPQPPGPATVKSLFGLPHAVQLFVSERCAALQIDISDELLTALPGQFKAFEKRGSTRTLLGSLWFAIAYDRVCDLQNLLDYPDEASSLAEMVVGVATQTMWGLYQSRQAHADPVTGLPGAEEFRARLRRVAKQQNADQVGLFLLSIDDYAQQRKRIGQERAEALVRQGARLLEQVVRKDDALFSYREAQFAVIAQVPNEQAGEHFANKLLGALARLTDLEQATATASLGYIVQAGDATAGIDAQALCLYAEQALDHARMSGGQRCVHFSGSFTNDEFSQRHLVSSLLTDPERGYRNNYILWQTLSLLAAETEPARIAAAFTSLLTERLEARRAMLIGEADGVLTLLEEPDALLGNRLSQERLRLVQKAFAERAPQADSDPVENTHWLAVPLLSRGLLHGCLFLEAVVVPDAADQIFIRALADQLAGALDRANLVRAGMRARDEESQALRAKLSSLEHQLPNDTPTPVAHSHAMRSVMEFVQRVAPTDVSVLIMGESGAGKEIMARSLHAASQRAAAPLVVVDCSAITPSLIESELFGRVKGAFTGADVASEGRIAQADGGTLFLDEIGELPLDVQAKLLRFVQEKEVVAVGSTETRIIDTRILCATNRDLAVEVNKGRFRADLYYRLQAIQVEVPPLRNRLEDLPVLVRRFLQNFNEQFERGIEDLSDAAWQAVRTYPWPGNVRELQNVLMRAVLTAQDDVLHVHDLRFESSDGGVADVETSTPTEEAEAELALGVVDDITPAPSQNPWAELQALLCRQVEAAYTHSDALAPLGRWLADTVILTAWEVHQRVVMAAARALGVPETTLRRQLNKARQNQNNPLQAKSAEWLAELPLLSQVLHRLMLEPSAPAQLAEACEALLIAEIAARVGDDHAAGATLLGVTPPTFLRRLSKAQAKTLPDRSVWESSI